MPKNKNSNNKWILIYNSLDNFFVYLFEINIISVLIAFG